MSTTEFEKHLLLKNGMVNLNKVTNGKDIFKDYLYNDVLKNNKMDAQEKNVIFSLLTIPKVIQNIFLNDKQEFTLLQNNLEESGIDIYKTSLFNTKTKYQEPNSDPKKPATIENQYATENLLAILELGIADETTINRMAKSATFWDAPTQTLNKIFKKYGTPTLTTEELQTIFQQNISAPKASVLIAKYPQESQQIFTDPQFLLTCIQEHQMFSNNKYLMTLMVREYMGSTHTYNTELFKELVNLVPKTMDIPLNKQIVKEYIANEDNNQIVDNHLHSSQPIVMNLLLGEGLKPSDEKLKGIINNCDLKIYKQRAQGVQIDNLSIIQTIHLNYDVDVFQNINNKEYFITTFLEHSGNCGLWKNNKSNIKNCSSLPGNPLENCAKNGVIHPNILGSIINSSDYKGQLNIPYPKFKDIASTFNDDHPLVYDSLSQIVPKEHLTQFISEKGKFQKYSNFIKIIDKILLENSIKQVEKTTKSIKI